VDLKNAGHVSEARAVLRDLLAQDARCIDAHVHISNLMFDPGPVARVGSLPDGGGDRGGRTSAWLHRAPALGFHR